MVEETPWQQALRYENRPNPYPFYEELRKTPVSRQPDGTYVVSTYRELVQLLHDPRVSSDARKRPGGPVRRSPSPSEGGRSSAETDPPEHDVDRRRMMRHFGPPECPHMVADLEPEIRRIFGELLDNMKGKTRIDVVDEFAFPGPVTVICKVLGVPLEDIPRFHDWIEAALDGRGPRPGGERPGAAAPRCRRVRAGGGRVQAVPGRPARPVPRAARTGHVVGDGPTTTARRGACPRSRSSTTPCSCSSPGMRPRST